MKFHFALAYDMRAPDFGASPTALYQAALDQCEWGDSLGFASCNLTEHHASDDGYLPSPIVMGSAVAARTKNMGIMLVMLLPLYHPLRAAEDLAILDLISNGRLRLVMGAGYREEEYRQFGLSIKKRPSLMEEAVEALKLAWTGEPFEFRGETVRILPRPAQDPRPPILLGGTMPAAAARAARIADGFVPTSAELHEVYREELGKLGKPVPPAWPSGGRSNALFIHIADDPEEAWRKIAPHALHECNDYGRWGRGMPGIPYFETDSADELRASGLYQVLTPDEAVDYIGKNGGMTLKPLMGGLDPEFARQSLDLFEHKVLPRLA